MACTMTLDPRLRAIADCVPPCRLLADIGTDHGLLGAHLLLTKRCARVLFADISAPSLDKARALVTRLELLDRSAFVVGDGAKALPEMPDVAVVAGMGGLTIADIIEQGRDKLGDARLILQPNVALPALRARLSGAGYRLANEQIARLGRRFYVILEAVPGSAYYTARELLIGPVLLQTKPALLWEYAKFRARVAEKALCGAQNGNRAVCEALAFELSEWKELLICCPPSRKSSS